MARPLSELSRSTISTYPVPDTRKYTGFRIAWVSWRVMLRFLCEGRFSRSGGIFVEACNVTSLQYEAFLDAMARQQGHPLPHQAGTSSRHSGPRLSVQLRQWRRSCGTTSLTASSKTMLRGQAFVIEGGRPAPTSCGAPYAQDVVGMAYMSSLRPRPLVRYPARPRPGGWPFPHSTTC
jgi:hypothetical protein